jgi:SpoU rRNA methylase family enzyme
MNETRPRRKTEVLANEVGGEALLYSDLDEAVHVLNPMARFIWNCCDGQHTAEDIEREIHAAFTVPEGVDVAGDVRHTIDALADKGLLV